jgi:hypothetical protein
MVPEFSPKWTEPLWHNALLLFLAWHGTCFPACPWYLPELIRSFPEEFEMAVADVMKMVQENDVKFVDFRFTDTRGKEQHVGVPVKHFGADKFESGHAFDGSSIAGWKGIQASDMLLMPDPATAYVDPFMDETTLVISCDVVEPDDRQGLRPRPALHRQARRGLPEVHRHRRHRLLRSRSPNSSSSIPSTWHDDMSGSLRARSVLRGSRLVLRRADRRRQHRPPSQGQGRLFPRASGRFSLHDIRGAMCLALEEMRRARSKCTTTRWPPPASARSAPSSPPW